MMPCRILLLIAGDQRPKTCCLVILSIKVKMLQATDLFEFREFGSPHQVSPTTIDVPHQWHIKHISIISPAFILFYPAYFNVFIMLVSPRNALLELSTLQHKKA